jgi:hypothetical protein
MFCALEERERVRSFLTSLQDVMTLRGLSGGFVSLHHRLISLKPPAWDAPEPEARKTLGFRGFTKHDEVRYNI